MNITSSKVVQPSTHFSKKTISPSQAPKSPSPPQDSFTFSRSADEVPSWKKAANGLAWAVAGGAVTGSVIGASAGSGLATFSPFTVTLALLGGGLGAWGSTVVSDKVILSGGKNEIEKGFNSAAWAASGGLVSGAAAGLLASTLSGYRLFSPFAVSVALAGGGLGAWGGSSLGGALYDSIPAQEPT